jgi:Holliday junction resolvase RusA-like endonuclease
MVGPLVIKGRIPSKKNNKRMIPGRGIISSKKYVEWEKMATWVLISQKVKANCVPAIKKCKMTLEFYGPDKRKWDLTNKAEGVMDALVKAGILIDDNYQVVEQLTLKYKGLDRDNPRVIIKIKV